MLTNGDFANGFDGWQFTSGHWTVSRKPQATPSTDGTACQCDRDTNKRTGVMGGWPVGAEDLLWQEVSLPEPTSQVIVSLTEIQHHDDGAAIVRLYGLAEDGPFLLWERASLEPDVPRANSQSDWHSNSYTVDVAESYGGLRLEFYGYCDAGIVGWKFTNVSLEIS